MKFKPLHDRVLIEVLDSSEKTAGGIIIPDAGYLKKVENLTLITNDIVMRGDIFLDNNINVLYKSVLCFDLNIL